MFLKLSNSSGTLIHCMDRKVRVVRIETTDKLGQTGIRLKYSRLKYCLRLLEEVCRKSRHIVIKTIRMRMSSLEDIVPKHRNMKIVHLVRDPRATLRSQKRYGKFKSYPTPFAKVSHYCNIISSDLDSAIRIIQNQINSENVDEFRHFDNKRSSCILRIRYEDIAQTPIKEAQKLYDFTGMNFNDNVRKRVHYLTSGGDSNKCGMICTVRRNSSTLFQSWRNETTFIFAQLIDRVCGGLYSSLGYHKVHSEVVMTNMSHSLLVNIE